MVNGAGDIQSCVRQVFRGLPARPGRDAGCPWDGPRDVLMDGCRSGEAARFSLSLLDNITELVLVTTTGIPALYKAKRAIAALRKIGFDKDRLKVAVNQLAKSQRLSDSDLDNLFGVPVFARFPMASQELHDASCKRGAARRMASSACRWRAWLVIAGIEEKPKSIVAKMFSFAEKPSIADGAVSKV